MERRINRNLVAVEATGAVLCFGGGILAGILGTLLSAIAWILGSDQHPWVHGLGTAFLVATIPLLIFSGFCLDWMERDPRKALDATSHKGELDSGTVFKS